MERLLIFQLLKWKDSHGRKPLILEGAADSKKNPQAQVLTRKNKTSQQVYFAQSVPYQKWMKKFKLSVKEDLCGCGNLIEQDNTPIASDGSASGDGGVVIPGGEGGVVIPGGDGGVVIPGGDGGDFPFPPGEDDAASYDPLYTWAYKGGGMIGIAKYSKLTPD